MITDSGMNNAKRVELWGSSATPGMRIRRAWRRVLAVAAATAICGLAAVPASAVTHAANRGAAWRGAPLPPTVGNSFLAGVAAGGPPGPWGGRPGAGHRDPVARTRLVLP